MFHFCRGRMRHAYALAYAQAYATPAFNTNDRYAEKMESRRHGSGGFGVRRPLRYLAHHLDLDDDQVRRVAAAFDRLKTEREQHRVTRASTAQDLAELLSDGKPSIDALTDAMTPRIDSAERMRLAVARAVCDIAEVLDDEQREQFAALISSKTIRM